MSNIHQKNLEIGVTVSKWIKLERGVFGLSASATLFDKIVFYVGRSDSWGISAEVCFYDRSITLKILNLYMGAELYHSPYMDHAGYSDSVN
jgi:hypothetical protein